MTLIGPCDFKMEKFVAGPAETFHPFYGSAEDGDITKWENLASFSQFVAHNTGDKGVHVVMADGVGSFLYCGKGILYQLYFPSQPFYLNVVSRIL